MATVTATTSGLRFSVPAIFTGHRPFEIPWHDLRIGPPRSSFFVAMRRLSVAKTPSASISVKEEFAEAILAVAAGRLLADTAE